MDKNNYAANYADFLVLIFRCMKLPNETLKNGWRKRNKISRTGDVLYH